MAYRVRESELPMLSVTMDCPLIMIDMVGNNRLSFDWLYFREPDTLKKPVTLVAEALKTSIFGSCIIIYRIHSMIKALR